VEIGKQRNCYVQKNRLWTWQGEPGAEFGYNGVWLSPTSLTSTIKAVMDHLESCFKIKYNGVMVTMYPPAIEHIGESFVAMAKHKDNNAHAGTLKDIIVHGINIFIDPLNPTQTIELSGWKLIVIEDSKSNRIVADCHELDNSLIIQGKGMQIGYVHEAVGVYSKYWRGILTFRYIHKEIVELEKKRRKYTEAPTPDILISEFHRTIHTRSKNFKTRKMLVDETIEQTSSTINSKRK